MNSIFVTPTPTRRETGNCQMFNFAYVLVHEATHAVQDWMDRGFP